MNQRAVRWYWRLDGVDTGPWHPHPPGRRAHRFIDTEAACGEPSGFVQWGRAPASAPKCIGCLRKAGGDPKRRRVAQAQDAAVGVDIRNKTTITVSA